MIISSFAIKPLDFNQPIKQFQIRYDKVQNEPVI